MVLPVIFPDGSTAELHSPPQLDLASSGVWPRTSGALGKDAASGRDLLIVYGNAERLTTGKAPVACYQGVDRSQVELRRSQDPGVRFWLLFRFGAWTVAMWDGNAGRLMGHQDRAVWARSLVGRETQGGWLVLRGNHPVRLGAEHDGDVQLQLGDLSPRAVLLWPVQCQPRQRPNTTMIGGHAVDLDVGSQWFASYCLPKAPWRCTSTTRMDPSVARSSRASRSKGCTTPFLLAATTSCPEHCSRSFTRSRAIAIAGPSLGRWLVQSLGGPQGPSR